MIELKKRKKRENKTSFIAFKDRALKHLCLVKCSLRWHAYRIRSTVYNNIFNIPVGLLTVWLNQTNLIRKLKKKLNKSDTNE